MPGLGASTGCVQRVVNANLAQKEPLASQHELLFWDPENRLAEVQDANGNTQERYGYDAGGARVKKTSGATTTYTFFAHYEEEVSSGTTTAISHYSFGGLRIAVKRGSVLYHLHGDHLGSTSLTTTGSVEEGSRAYHPYGSERSASGTLRTDRTYHGTEGGRDRPAVLQCPLLRPRAGHLHLAGLACAGRGDGYRLQPLPLCEGESA